MLLLFSHSAVSNSDPWTAACQASLSFTISQSLQKFMSIELVMPSNHLILCHPLLTCLQSFWASGSFPLSWLSASDGQSPGDSASASALPITISFWTGWFDLLAVQGALKSLQHHNSKASILQHSAIFMVKLSHSYLHDYWKNNSFDYTDLCWQSNVSAFKYAIKG